MSPCILSNDKQVGGCYCCILALKKVVLFLVYFASFKVSFTLDSPTGQKTPDSFCLKEYNQYSFQMSNDAAVVTGVYPLQSAVATLHPAPEIYCEWGRKGSLKILGCLPIGRRNNKYIQNNNNN